MPSGPEAVYVSPGDLATVVFHGSLIQVTGTDRDNGDRVTFMGDTRCVITLLNAVEESGEVQMAWVEPHMIWSRCPASETSCRVLLHVIAETACHAGHLDAARELIDGQTWLILAYTAGQPVGTGLVTRPALSPALLGGLAGDTEP